MTDVPQTVRGVIALIPEACTSCMLCVRECPSWCITLDSHSESIDEPGARRPRTVSVLDGFTIDYGLCMYCGICIDVCPFDALEWQPDHDYAEPTRAALVHDLPRLSSHLPLAAPPDAVDAASVRRNGQR